MARQSQILALTLILALIISAVSPASGQNIPPEVYPTPISSMAAPPLPTGSPTDFTDKLELRNGLHITFPIQNGLDTRWQLVGNYNFVCDVDYNDKRGYRFEWKMTHPANITGLRAVEHEDVRDSYKVSLFYPANESQAMIGFTSIVRISDHLYRKLKTGEPTEFSTDGPDSPLVLRKETRPVAREIRSEGIEYVTIELDGMRVPVRAIKATTDVGWSYWILDNPNFPIMLQGTGPFQWSNLKLVYDGGLLPRQKSPGSGGAGGDLRKAKREADNVINQLKSKGQATSYLILFDFDSDKLRPLSQEILSELSKYLVANPDLSITVEGHTCTIGGKEYNLSLSNRRAKSVKNYLIGCGVQADRLKPIGYGFSKPVASNKTNAGRAKNRRVVFTELKN